MKSQNHKLRRMLQDAEQALNDVIAGSPKAAEVVRKLRDKGYSLYLAPENAPASAAQRPGRRIELGPRPKARPAAPRTPAYRLDARDVAFLESIGIEATRPARGRRGA